MTEKKLEPPTTRKPFTPPVVREGEPLTRLTLTGLVSGNFD